ncbi:MAG: hypothetical protein H0U71_08845 [Gammaproteobacteria bacterium]|nr:hypothetical protein [Gammaproteobacteria bacterium]
MCLTKVRILAFAQRVHPYQEVVKTDWK